jgi:hypothetical protein
MPGLMNAPARTEIFVACSLYGPLSGVPDLGPAAGRARTWLVVDMQHPERLAVLRIGTTDPITGAVVYRDTQTVLHASMRPGKTRTLTVRLQDGSTIVHLEAPCLCGAGAIGYAGPTNQRHSVSQVRVDDLPWYTQQ